LQRTRLDAWHPEPMAALELPGTDVLGIRAANPGPFTLSGTNSWIVGRDPAWLIDPGPALADHVEALRLELEHRGGLGCILLTHDHLDHSEAVPAIRLLFPEARLAAARGEVDQTLAGGEQIAGLDVVATPGHAPDHLSFIRDGVAFTGDAVLGEGSVFVAPDPGALAGYLRGLERLQELKLDVIAPGHGPPVHDPAARIEQYVSHRRERERRLVDALGRGLRTSDELLDDVWDDAPAVLRPAAAVTLAAHLDKLEEEGRLPSGAERPDVSL
jgi:glyoxylase-like metal-dependent hydrolase (beta-lactamase superfamily II)